MAKRLLLLLFLLTLGTVQDMVQEEEVVRLGADALQGSHKHIQPPLQMFTKLPLQTTPSLEREQNTDAVPQLLHDRHHTWVDLVWK